MFQITSIRRKLSFFLVFTFTFLFIFQLSLPWVNAKEAAKPEIKDWHISGIVAALDDDYPGVQGVAFDKLTKYELKNLNKKQATWMAKKAIKLLKDEKVDSEFRSNAARALGNLKDAAKPYIQDILAIFKDERVDSNVRTGAAKALVNLGNLGDAAKPYVQDILAIFKVEKDEMAVSSFYIHAALVLGNLGDAAKPYIQDILAIVKDEKIQPIIRSDVAEALGDLGDVGKPYIQDIFAIVKDEKINLYVRIGAAEALGNLGGVTKPYVQDILAIVKDEKVDSSIRYEAAGALGNLGGAAKPYVQDILALLKDEKIKPIVRSYIAEALGNLGDVTKPYVKDIIAIVKDEKINSSIRRSAVKALGNLGDVTKPYVKDILAIVKDEKINSSIRRSAAEALGNLGDVTKPYVKDILAIIKDEKVDSSIRYKAAGALGNLGGTAKPYVKDILVLVEDEKVDLDVRYFAAVTLEKIEKLSLNQVLTILNFCYYPSDLYYLNKSRFQSYFLAGGTDEVKTLLKWLAHYDSSKIPTKLTHKEAKKTLKLFAKIWQPSEDLRLRKDLADKIVQVTKLVSWQPQDIVLLQTHYNNLKNAKYSEADSIESVIIQLKGWRWFFNFRNIILIHAAFWLLLIFAYPKSPQIQAIFFWNPWVRKIFGMGYVGFLLTWVPFLRRKLFEPFKPSLLADAQLDNFTEKSYFSSSRIVKNRDSKQFLTITQAIPNIKGQTVLIGDSGLGKSMFLRHLAKTSQQTVVYLPASKCEKGVIAAIQAKLHGQAQDARFLKNLIYSGAIDICIDGLNEVTADTRSQIKQFVESYFRGNIIMATQPLEWEPPTTAKIFYLKPLQQQQIEEFLISRQFQNSQDFLVKGAEYEKACKKYLKQAFHKKQPQEELDAIERVLSNPMDLTLVAQMLSQGKQPDLFRLQEQQYNLMAAEYKQEWGHSFPLKKFSSSVYEMRLNDGTTLDAEEYHQELLSLEDQKYKMVISRQWQSKNGEAMQEWYFRHDKIMDFFLVQNFLGDSDEIQIRLNQHIGDPRFRGVYFLLANLLKPDAALQLRETLILYAANTNDHTVSDTFVKLLHSRVASLKNKSKVTN
ncbi:HEAT repeat-containing protein [Rivularia sp. PCC 7116]|uniref:HEAT repeat domain-containing protein n=1 Tax=Rivularia sp. PCC 7116 TaxID=373994 RepID=UPI00029EE022|nr:HEAT repeat domain-containing protein [Rivularia sp. PCC 7116]AFY58878.1 HEAT repeat-containing protein [Rivularia sp. PCC 7116]